ncbi:phosphomannose isomerase type II C-terminal cupin domain [Nocardioides sp. CFH 31398]|uniref:phosphomannose isomerase type II C-terminal cupin domain n=1 Tax=Nocardioides sp. CFH 31398 TaxID=2919579 RepID=UPI001F06826E|nr:phosphomannose isomerase type II C-terminal cupin domain [Nocardioides sp. CFH 31398]MCH1867531.1 phosphomannose isomerase type II C-terminal cupin domain [Nocardioides sp. CFH 31398]
MSIDTALSAGAVLASETRPWGSWCVVDAGPGYQVKRLLVLPGRRLSYQTHEHRSEHWVVIHGRATCTLDGEVRHAGPGESVDVPQGAAHRLANGEDVDLVVVEVQRGAYLGEDDICRLSDDFGRTDA